jgi:hypothetical protein
LSPLKPVTVSTRRVFVVLALIALPALPVAAWVVSSSVSDNQRLTEAIQEQRRDSILYGCREQNARHDRTIATLDRLIAQAPAGRRERARQGRAGTVLLIEALAPKRDCAALVTKAAPTPK